MDMYAVFGELLYIISNYEKGRIKSRGFWSRKYIASLNESLYYISIILQLMITPPPFQQATLLSIKKFCEQNELTIFPRGDLTLLDDIENATRTDDLRDEYVDIVCKMRNIVDECIVLLREKRKGYKGQIAFLIKSFHNLPRVFLDPSKRTIYNINAKPIHVHDAILYASSYIRQW